MELIKAIIALITSFFQNSTQKKKQEVKLADAVEVAVVEKIRATENAKAVEQQVVIREALEELNKTHREEREHAKTDANADDSQFGSDW